MAEPTKAETAETNKPIPTWKEILKPYASHGIAIALAALTAWLASKGYLPTPQ